MYHQCCLIFHMQCNCEKDKDLCTVYIFVFTSPNWFNVYRSLFNSSESYIPVILKKKKVNEFTGTWLLIFFPKMKMPVLYYMVWLVIFKV